MPYIKHIPIHTGTYLKNSLKYIHNPDKAYSITGLNCPDNINASVSLFELHSNSGLQECKKNRTRIAHHYVQSFLPGTINEDDAHEIGVEVTKIIAPGYMCHVSTHKDTNHIHNHIFIFSVHPETGYKYRHNDDQYKFVQEQSDALCLERGIRIIENPRIRDISSKEYRAMERGGSWKDILAWDIDDAVDNSVAENSGKEGFVSYLKDKGYIVNWQNKNISVKLPDHKAIRVDTLAKAYGERYTKENIERRLHGENIVGESEATDKDDNKLPKHFKYGDTNRFNEFDRYMDWCMKKDKEIIMDATKRESPQLDFYRNKHKEKEKKRDSSIKYPKVLPIVKVHNTEREKKRKKARSSKDILAWDIDDAVDNSVAENSGKEGFVSYLKDKGYIVKYQNKNISIQIPGRKTVRVDTLAKTHGNQYTKENIERRLKGLNSEIEANIADYKAEETKVNSTSTRRWVNLFGHIKSTDKNKYSKTKDEREIEKEMEDIGRTIGRILNGKRLRSKPIKGTWAMNKPIKKEKKIEKER